MASESSSNTQFSTLNELFLKAVEKHQKPDAFLSRSAGQYRGLSSSDALKKAAALARAFDRLGVRQADRVAILSENRVEWPLTDYALLGLGVIVVPIYPTLLEPDLEVILQDSACRGIVAANEAQVRKILNVRARLPELRFVVAMDCGGLDPADALDWSKMVEDELKSAPDPIDAFRARSLAARPQDTATILYTSGTTANPKGVVLTHANIVSNIHATQDLFPLADHDVAISFLPLSHIFERMLDYEYFWEGVAIAYAESFETLPQNLLEVRPTVIAVVPRVLEKICEKVKETVSHMPPSPKKLFQWGVKVGEAYFPYRIEGRTPPLGLRLKHALGDALVCRKIRERLGGRVEILISGAAPLSPELATFFYAMGLAVYEGYGLTETSPVIAVNCPGAVKLGTVGRVIPGVEVKLGEEFTDQRDQVGREVLVRGPNVTPGYYHLDDENRQAFVDGWFHTGDLGAIDSDGFLRITGRKKYLFKTSGGKYVPPEKLENLFQGHPYVGQIVVLGDGRNFISALIVPDFPRLEAYASEHGIGFTSRRELVAHPAILAFMQSQVDDADRWLPQHERIHQIALLPREFTIDSGELSPTQKIKRRVVEERYRDLIEEIYRRRAPQSQHA